MRNKARKPTGVDGESREALIILAIVASCTGLFAGGFDSPLGQAISCCIASVILLLLLPVLRPSSRFWHRRRWPILLFGAGLGWIACVALTRALFPSGTINLPLSPDLFLPKFLATIAGLQFLLIGAIVAQRSADRYLAVLCLAICITLSAVAGILLMFGASNDLLPRLQLVEKDRLLGLVGNANVMASICGAGALLCAAIGLPEWRAKERAMRSENPYAMSLCAILAVPGLLINFAALILTASRFGALAAVVALLLLFLHHGYADRQSWRSLLAEVAGIGVLVLLAIALFSGILAQRAETIAPDAFARLAMWDHFFRIADVAPWTGFGPGAFPQANIYFLQNSTVALRQIWIINSPHSILLQLWFVGGLPYLLLMTGGGLLIARDIVRQLDILHCGSIQIGLLLSGSIIVAMGLIDIQLDVTASADLAFLLTGLAWGRRQAGNDFILLHGAA